MNRTKLIIDYAAYVAVRTVVCIIQAAPLSTCQAWSRRLGWLFWHVFKLRRATVEENLKTAFPEKSPAEHEASWHRSSVAFPSEITLSSMFRSPTVSESCVL